MTIFFPKKPQALVLGSISLPLSQNLPVSGVSAFPGVKDAQDSQDFQVQHLFDSPPPSTHARVTVPTLRAPIAPRTLILAFLFRTHNHL